MKGRAAIPAEANKLLRQLPSLNQLLEHDVLVSLCASSREVVTHATRETLSELRQRILAGELQESGLQEAVLQLPHTVTCALERQLRPGLRRVINATGVILQTNLGRAPLSEDAIQRMAEVARGYRNLEFDLEAGKRSRRDVHAEGLILALLKLHGVPHASAQPPEDFPMGAAVVNNCAAATFLALNTLAEGGEVIVSRGELVEIGGGFRIPEILAKSGSVLREVGTTNKTRVGDYAAAIGPATKLILKVHRSNFRIEGFTEQPSLEDLVALGKTSRVPVFEDQGTGCVLDLATVGLPGESSWLRSVASGAALIASSGDKLLGGPQCGILVGPRDTVECVRANPLFRALRVDKLTYAALEATLLAYITGRERTLPVVNMLQISPEDVRLRCERLAARVRSPRLHVEVVPTRSVVGGGTTPGASLPSFAVALSASGQSEDALSGWLRRRDPPVVARVSEGQVLLDLRTVALDDDEVLVKLLQDNPAREQPPEPSSAGA